MGDGLLLCIDQVLTGDRGLEFGKMTFFFSFPPLLLLLGITLVKPHGSLAE